jgi:ADP-heptose:LPS heptosyltransferase
MGRSHEFILQLLADTDFEVIVIGGPGEEWVRNEISSINNPRIRFAFNAFNLTKLGAVIQQCGYFVGGDSGPMHIAAAVGAKVVGIFGYASETRFRPWSEKAEVVSLRYHCSPDQRGTYEANCQKCIYPENRCLTELSVDKVMSEIQSFFLQNN